MDEKGKCETNLEVCSNSDLSSDELKIVEGTRPNYTRPNSSRANTKKHLKCELKAEVKLEDEEVPKKKAKLEDKDETRKESLAEDEEKPRKESEAEDGEEPRKESEAEDEEEPRKESEAEDEEELEQETNTEDEGKLKEAESEDENLINDAELRETELLNTVGQEIERQLDEKAAKNNMTVTNVKNMIRHIITNEHVIAMVRKSVSDSPPSPTKTHLALDLPFAPILTRSRAKELLKQSHVAMWPVTPAKKCPNSQVLINQELPEDSSDEEYDPNHEEQAHSDDDKENDSLWSDMDSLPTTPGFPATPASASEISFTDDGLFKVPQENIGQRTRSKMPLVDTPLETIEQAFAPPDITTDMYEFDCYDEEWENFLKDFTRPLKSNINDTVEDEDEADPEYNILADEENEKVDMVEELRDDRAVKVSKKELKSLFDELLEVMPNADELPTYQDIIIQGLPEIPGYYSNKECERVEKRNAELEANGTDSKIEHSAGLLTISNEHGQLVEEPLVYITQNQRKLLRQQMRKHVQLMTQHFLMTYRHEYFSSFALQCKNNLVCLQHLTSKSNTQSYFQVENLKDSLHVICEWEKIMSDNSSEYLNIKRFMENEIETHEAWKTRRRSYVCRLPRQLMDVVSNSKAFIYPLLLPTQAFTPFHDKKKVFLPPENSLLAIGMEEFSSYLEENDKCLKFKPSVKQLSDLISTHLMPCKDTKMLCTHIREKKRNRDNPVGYYQKHQKAPETKHFVIPFDSKTVLPPKKQPLQLLPEVWQRHIFPDRSPIKSTVALFIKNNS